MSFVSYVFLSVCGLSFVFVWLVFILLAVSFLEQNFKILVKLNLLVSFFYELCMLLVLYLGKLLRN